MSQLPVDCLYEIFECLEEDKITSHLVNRLWCGVSVRILWTSVWNYDTLLACLPNESKEILYEKELSIRLSHYLIILHLLKILILTT